ncbi:MAG TPA: hypothetical protein VFE51_20935 [Verrucomicrobiae bacterium]|nr:hypothetical protein [Verrucomicrobiae bacterium]
MNRLLWTLLSVCIGVLSARAWLGDATRSQDTAVRMKHEGKVAANQLEATRTELAALRTEVQNKKRRIEEASLYPTISPQLLALIEGGLSGGTPAAWAELRQQLGIGWSSSPDYVLVSKRAVKRLPYSRINANAKFTEAAFDLLAISPEERTAVNSVLLSNLNQTLNVKFSEPSGDIVAQYTVVPPDAGSELSLSNNLASGLTEALGSERTSLLFPNIWPEFKSHIGPSEPETITVRQSMVDGQPDLTWEASRGNSVVSSAPVRYAHYPAWFLEIFPGGWQTLADHAGFQLPSRFHQ